MPKLARTWFSCLCFPVLLGWQVLATPSPCLRKDLANFFALVGLKPRSSLSPPPKNLSHSSDFLDLVYFLVRELKFLPGLPLTPTYCIDGTTKCSSPHLTFCVCVLCRVGVYCGIYKSSYNTSSRSYFNTSPSLFSYTRLFLFHLPGHSKRRSHRRGRV
jgi:hypothetical protein